MKKRILIVLLLCVFGTALAGGLYLLSSQDLISIDDEKEAFDPVEINDEETIASVPDYRVSIVISGSNVIHESILNQAKKDAPKTKNQKSEDAYDFRPLYKNIQGTLGASDFAVCNQTTLVGANNQSDAFSGYPLFNAPAKLADDLIEVGFDAFNIASNHLLDLGSGGKKNSVMMWKQKKTYLIGGESSEQEWDDVASKIIEIDGVNLCFLGYTATTNGLYPDKDTFVPYYTLNETALRKDRVQSQIRAAKDVADAVIVLVNWANNASFDVTEHQTETAAMFCEAGADVIVGVGPAVIQKIEWITDREGTHKTLCAYSLGNTMGTMQYMENLLGGFLSFTAVKDHDHCYISDVLFRPTVIHYDQLRENIALYPLQAYTEEIFSRHGSNLLYGFSDYKEFVTIPRKVIAPEFLPANLRN